MFVAGMGTSVIAGNLSRFQLRLLSTYPEVRSVLLYDHYRPKVGGRADSASRDSLRHVFWLSTLGLTAIAWLTAPLPGLWHRFTPRIHRLNTSCDSDLAKCFIYAYLVRLMGAPAGFKGARDARYAMWVSMLRCGVAGL